MTKLEPDTLLQRRPDLRLRLGSNNSLRIKTEEGTIAVGPHGLAVLDAFARPRPFGEALAALLGQAAGSQDWMDITNTVLMLHKAGILREPAKQEAQLKPAARGYDTAPIHVAMLNDQARTEAYLAAIREVVRPGDVVVDVGTGTGVLAIAAAQAGARQVYAVEASAIAGVAQAMFEANDVADRITIVEGWSTQIELPERADVLVSEMIGNDPLAERLLETTADAVKRLLRPRARLVPGHISVWGLPVSIPEWVAARHVFGPETIESYREWYGMEFGPLRQAGRRPFPFYLNPFEARQWDIVGDPAPLAAVDLAAVGELVIDRRVEVVLNPAASLDGVLIYFELQLGPTTRLSTHPAQATPDNHWESPVWILPEPLSAPAAGPVRLRYQYNPGRGGATLDVQPASESA